MSKCKSSTVNVDLFVFWIAFKKRLPYTVIKKVNENIVDMPNKSSIDFIDNGNISNMDLHQDRWHFLGRGNCLSENNLIFVLNNPLSMHTHPPFNRHQAPLGSSSGEINLQILQELRLHHRKKSS